MENLGRCKQRIVEDGPGNYSSCIKSALHRQWKFAEISGYNKPGTEFAL